MGLSSFFCVCLRVGLKLRFRLGQRVPASWSQYANIMLVPNMVPSAGHIFVSSHGVCKHGSLESMSTGSCDKNTLGADAWWVGVGHLVQLSGMVEKRNQHIMTTTRTWKVDEH